MEQESGGFKGFMDKIYGGLTMSYRNVVLYAIGTAVLTALFLIVPFFKDTSFSKMGETLEAWIFFAVILMANCEKPLDSAIKTFLFFLISQPLIYLLQVPFSHMGWGLFGYYKYWFILTLLTFPAAFIGFYIRKKNWLSLLILSPALLFLGSTGVEAFQFTFRHFPYHIVTAVFCLLQIVIYLYVFTPLLVQKVIGGVVSFASILILFLAKPGVEVAGTNFLPDSPVLSGNAVVSDIGDEEVSVSVSSTGEDSMVRVEAKKYVTTTFQIQDGENIYKYELEIYEDENGHTQVKITPQ